MNKRYQNQAIKFDATVVDVAIEDKLLKDNILKITLQPVQNNQDATAVTVFYPKESLKMELHKGETVTVIGLVYYNDDEYSFEEPEFQFYAYQIGKATGHSL